jgi:hypothetical protein
MVQPSVPLSSPALASPLPFETTLDPHHAISNTKQDQAESDASIPTLSSATTATPAEETPAGTTTPSVQSTAAPTLEQHARSAAQATANGQPASVPMPKVAAAPKEEEERTKGKWGAMPLKYRILKSCGMPTKDNRREEPTKQEESAGATLSSMHPHSPSIMTAHDSAAARWKKEEQRRMEEERNDKIEAGLAQARERERKEREDEDLLLLRRRGAAIKRTRSEDSGTGISVVNLRTRKEENRPRGKRIKRDSEDEDGDENDERDGDHIEGQFAGATARSQYQQKKKQRRVMIEEDEYDELENAEEIKTRMEVIINKYDAMKDKNTAVAFLLNVIRNSNR